MPPEKPEIKNPPLPEKQGEQNSAPVEETSLHSLRTYQGDVEEALAKNKTSVSSIVVAEQKRRDAVLSLPEEKAHTESRNKTVVVTGLLLILIGIIAVVLVYETEPKNIPTVEQQAKAIINFSEEKGVPVLTTSREELVQVVLKEKKSFDLQPNSILYIHMRNASGTPAKIADVLSLATPKMPASLSRSFEGQYMFGIYSFDKNAPFIILQTRDFAGSFSGMLKWEEGMLADLGEMFGITGTTTPLFVDKSFQNKDLRILRDGGGKTVLLYSFIDRNTLVITTQENILTGIITKYLTRQTVR